VGLTPEECREALARHASRKFQASIGRVAAIAVRRLGPQKAWMLVAVDADGVENDDFSAAKLKWTEAEET